MFQKIVVGTDGSATAGGAVELAVQLARTHKASLHLVVAAPASAAAPTGARAGSGLKAAGQHLLDQVAGGAKGVDVSVHTGVGDPADVIVKLADKVGADLIVVGSKGMRGGRRILGSVPNSVAHKAGCHVLVARTV